MSIGIIWHQVDLRTEWNPALFTCSKKHDKILPIFIFTPEDEELGEASLWWLEKSLQELEKEYQKLGCHLLLQKGDPIKILDQLIKKTEAKGVYWNIRFEPIYFKMQEKVNKHLKKTEIPVEIFNGNHLIDPREIKTKEGKPYSVFTPFSKACLKEIEVPSSFPKVKKCIGVKGLKNDNLSFSHEKWMDKLATYWIPGRSEGVRLLKKFVKGHLKDYSKERDYPATTGTSLLSPYLHFGELSPLEIWATTKKGKTFQRQLLWREFGTYFLFHFPKAKKENWDHKFDRFKWEKNAKFLKKWAKGQTGYPIVDAGMRQLWETGWMHNRLRMIVASFLTKDLFIHWKEGEKWFWNTLVDADRGNNVLGWQWTAGTGPDAAPYFRIFNPILQGEKFDPDGEFIREYIPELKNLPSKWIHHPWDAPEEVLKEAGITLGKNYPLPLVDHGKARSEALKRFQRIK